MVATIILGMFADVIIDKLISGLADNLQDKLRGDPAQKAIKHAISNAIERYAVGTRLALVKPFIREDGLFTDKDVSSEFATILSFNQTPNTALIATKWKQALDNPPQWRDFTKEADLLLKYFEDELKETDVFQPVFQSKSLSAIETNSEATTKSLENIEGQLASLIDLIDAQFGTLSESFLKGAYSISNEIRDDTRFIKEKTRGFVGRQFVFDAVEQFVNDNPRGYFFVRGDPGIGKSAIAAELIKRGGYIHHFNIRPEGKNKVTDFLKNVCAQLIAAYDLDYTSLPAEATRDGGFLGDLLAEVSAKLQGEKCVIVIDALDEVDLTGLPERTNILYLPRILPQGIFIIATARREKFSFRIEINEQDSLYIEQDDAGNIADIQTYIEGQTNDAGIERYIQRHEIDTELFVDHMVEKSQGNFIYLRMVLPEIASGAYTELDLTHIPAGLTTYYQDHWERMRRQDELDWFDYKLPVIVALTVINEPVSIDLIEEFSYINDKRRIRAVLRDFDQFIYRTDVEYEGGLQTRYRWYHASFFDFIKDKEDIAEERVDLAEGNKKVADALWNDLFDEDF